VNNLHEAIRDRVVILDGGLATQLEAQGHDLSSKLWSARLLRDDPDEIVRAHRAFFDAGAEVAISASYQASFDGLAGVGLDADAASALMVQSIRLARRAADSGGDETRRWVAASVGPYGAALADGSEYHGDYGLSVAELRDWHRARFEVLADSGADVLAIETIPSLTEVEAVLDLVRGSGVPAWLSLSCGGGRTRAGEDAAEAFAMVAGIDEIIAVGVNCTESHEVADLASRAAASAQKPVVVYPNSGEGWDADARDWVGDPTYEAGMVTSWIANGSRLVGGCCRVTPSQIAEIKTESSSATARADL
jgi:homocysteine S-methyltransferase